MDGKHQLHPPEALVRALEDSCPSNRVLGSEEHKRQVVDLAANQMEVLEVLQHSLKARHLEVF